MISNYAIQFSDSNLKLIENQTAQKSQLKISARARMIIDDLSKVIFKEFSIAHFINTDRAYSDQNKLVLTS